MNAAQPESGPLDGAQDRPWWRYGHVWLVIAGPLAVVLAGVATAVIAVRSPDPVLAAAPAGKSLAPAIQGRNHAATPAQGSAP
jgi:hypothetical protein